AIGRELSKAQFPGNLATIYNGLSTSRSGNLLTKYFSGTTDASTFLVIDPDTLDILSSIDSPVCDASGIAGSGSTVGARYRSRR
ncbi:MAG: hypothetical protein R6W79_06010, partial [Acidimicrobiia bacterium]